MTISSPSEGAPLYTSSFPALQVGSGVCFTSSRDERTKFADISKIFKILDAADEPLRFFGA